MALPELRQGNIGLVVAAQIARYVSPGNSLSGWHSPKQAWVQTQAQLAWYKAATSMTLLEKSNRHTTLKQKLRFLRRVW